MFIIIDYKNNSLPVSDIVTVALSPMTNNGAPSRCTIYKPKDSLNSNSEFDKIVTLNVNPLEPAANVIISSTC